MKNIYIIALSFFLALAGSYVSNREGAWVNLKFRTSGQYRNAESEAIKSAVHQYNKNSASFYNSAGFIAGLGEIPATPRIKRRIFKDINMLKGDGLVMIFDKDLVEIQDVSFISRELAVATSNEIWAIALQDSITRKPVLTIKAVEINVRYVFRKTSLQQDAPVQWILFEMDVFPQDEEIPGLNIESVL